MSTLEISVLLLKICLEVLDDSVSLLLDFFLFDTEMTFFAESCITFEIAVHVACPFVRTFYTILEFFALRYIESEIMCKVYAVKVALLVK